MEKIGQKWLELARNDGKKLAFLSSSVTLEQVIGQILASSEPFFGQNLTFLLINQHAVVWKITEHAKAWQLVQILKTLG